GFVEAMYECLAAGERIHIKNFGSFFVTDVPARDQYDPDTGEIRTAPPYKNIRFKPSPKLREFLENNDFDMEYGYIIDAEEEDDV
ncbi:MAG: HU family DNA-binding protein, partial [Bacteroidaceae bacterium]|nr:HU family DNA-binding protein [Bacteroidaceae bacterium]